MTNLRKVKNRSARDVVPGGELDLVDGSVLELKERFAADSCNL